MARSTSQSRASARIPPPAAAVTQRAAQDAAPEAFRPFGPIRLAAVVYYGVPHLRRLLNLSAGVDLDRLCEDAALRIMELETRAMVRAVSNR